MMRKIEHDDLRKIEIASEQFQKAAWCESETKGCFLNDHGIIRPFCDRFIWHHDGFKCDKAWR